MRAISSRFFWPPIFLLMLLALVTSCAYATPTAPQNLSVTASSTQVVLTWDAVQGATSYKVKRTTDATGTFANVGTPATNSYNDSGLNNNTTYYYEVSAVDGTGEGPVSLIASATPRLSAPTNPAAAAGNAKVALNWDAVSGKTSYSIYRSTVAGGPYTAVKTLNSTESWTDTGVTNGTTYYYVVMTVSTNGGESPNSTEVSATPNATALAAPAGFSATAGNGQVSLAWTAVSGATGYKVKRQTTGGNFSVVGTPSTNSYTDMTATNGVAYTYKVSATNAVGESVDSTTSSATPKLTAPVVIATPGNGQVALSWGAVPNATGYTVKMGTSSNNYPNSQATTGTSYTWTGLTNNTTYYFVVIANAALSAGNSPNSTQVSAVPSLAGPTALAATPGNASVSLSWPAVTSATSYKLYRKIGAGGTYVLVASNIATTTYNNNTGLTNGTTYYYQVTAIVSGYESLYSPEASATPAIVSPPTNLVATSGSGQVTLTWTASPTSGVTYYIYRGTTSGTYPNSYTTTSTSWTQTGLTNGTTYYYIVKAKSGSTYSTATSEVAVTPQPIPGTPTLNTPTIGNMQVMLSWTAAANAATYTVKMGTTSGTYTSTQSVSGSTTSYNWTGLTNGTTYYFRVAGVNSSGIEGTASAEKSAKPRVTPPVNFTAVPGSSQVTLSWDAVPGATGYKVKGGTSSGNYGTPRTVAAGTTSYVWSSLNNGTTYYFAVVASDAAGDSANSFEANATPLPVPTAPTNLQATSGDASAGLTWTTVSGATSYKIKRSTTSGGPYTTVATGVAANNYQDAGLTNGTTYFYVVSAVNSAGESGNSNQASTTPLPNPPNAPDAPTFANPTTTTLDVTAPALPTGADSLTLQVKQTGQSASAYQDAETGIAGGATTQVYGLDSGTSYDFRFVAVNTGGNAAGTEATYVMPTPAVTWTAGSPISCGGIYFPDAASATIHAGAQGRFNAYLATDWDGKDTTIDGVTTSSTYSDPCSYTWSSDGGQALNGINTGQSFVWIAPSTPGTYTVYLTVDDQNDGNKPGGEAGSRDDAGYDDTAANFSITVTVVP